MMGLSSPGEAIDGGVVVWFLFLLLVLTGGASSFLEDLGVDKANT